MITVKYQCQNCEYIEKHYLKNKNWDDAAKFIDCPKCGFLSEKLFPCPRHEIKETNEPFSAKPGSYWRNAEKNRQKVARKKAEAEAEKKRYGKKD